ncbi:MAG: DUF6115 domain-containing protein [Spirochaetaceae bacterium]
MNSFLVVVMNVGLAAAVYLLLVRRIDRKLEPGRVVDRIRSEIDGIIVELNQTTDRNIGLIEDRVTRLNSLLEQADRRLAVLKREMESRRAGTERYNDILQRASRSRTGEGEAQPREGEAPAPEAQSAGPQEASDSRTARRKEVVELHRKGIASNIIANRTGTTVGEVELIISLADRKE